MTRVQPGITGPVPRLARYLRFSTGPDSDIRAALTAVRDALDGDRTVVGIGPSAVAALGKRVAGLRNPAALSGPGLDVPSTPGALWCWLRGDDRGELLHRSRTIIAAASAGFELDDIVDAFQYGPSLDLTGYVDGTENPEGDDAVRAAVVRDAGPGLDGASFVAVQHWRHDLDRFQAMSQTDRDHSFGRRLSDNEEIDDAPESAHVKRTAQESFDPEAFVLRRSMPWAHGAASGLVFVAFGHSFDAFEALLQRMVGADDGIVDALFTFTRPLTGSYYWCPPMTGDRIDLSALGL